MQAEPTKPTISLSLSKSEAFNPVDIKLPKRKRDFDANTYGEMVRNGFSRLYQDDGLSDITLVVGKERIPSHKLVLSVWCDKFDISKDEIEIDLAEEDAENFKLMLRHMYTGQTDFITTENILPLVVLSHEYGIDSLKEVCGELLGVLVSDETLFYFLDVVKDYEVNQLEAVCGEHLAENFNDLSTGDRLMELEPTTWARLLRSDDLRNQSEEELFNSVLRYCDFRFKGDEEARNQALTTILPFVRFPFLSPEFIVEKVEGNRSLSQLPIVRELLHETYKHKVLPKAVTSFRTKRRSGRPIYDGTKCNTNITLSEDLDVATLKVASGWANVIVEYPITKATPYFEFKVENGSSGQLMLGMIDGSCATAGYAGQWNNGWSYYSSGQLYHSGGTQPVVGPTYQTGDIIGMLMEFDSAKVTFYKNGVVATSCPNVNPNSVLRPHVSLNSVNNSISLVSFPDLPPNVETEKSKKRRAPKTYSFDTELSSQPADPLPFIKRILKF